MKTQINLHDTLGLKVEDAYLSSDHLIIVFEGDSFVHLGLEVGYGGYEMDEQDLRRWMLSDGTMKLLGIYTEDDIAEMDAEAKRATDDWDRHRLESLEAEVKQLREKLS